MLRQFFFFDAVSHAITAITASKSSMANNQQTTILKKNEKYSCSSLSYLFSDPIMPVTGLC